MADHLAADHQRAGLEAAEVAMLDYAVKLTLRPWEMEEEDVLALRRAGFDDTAILDINQVTGYFAYVNRLADGLGVALESIWDDGVRESMEEQSSTEDQDSTKDQSSGGDQAP